MELHRIVMRVLFAYVSIVVLVRISGHRTIRQGDVLSFVLAVVLGDMFDDLFWAEVPAAQFLVAVTALVGAHMWTTGVNARSGERIWRNARLKAARGRH
jgi:uncharacterized membrane protein YcaP (DUF421 family)